MNDLKREHVMLELCVVCKKDIQIDQKKISICKDPLGNHYVHDGECYSKYSKLLTDPEEVKRGMIIGLCIYCITPVRNEDEYQVSRIEHGGTNWSAFDTTVPKKKAIYFAHQKCFDNASC